jgi:hypothetical protein
MSSQGLNSSITFLEIGLMIDQQFGFTFLGDESVSL